MAWKFPPDIQPGDLVQSYDATRCILIETVEPIEPAATQFTGRAFTSPAAAVGQPVTFVWGNRHPIYRMRLADGRTDPS